MGRQQQLMSFATSKTFVVSDKLLLCFELKQMAFDAKFPKRHSFAEFQTADVGAKSFQKEKVEVALNY